MHSIKSHKQNPATALEKLLLRCKGMSLEGFGSAVTLHLRHTAAVAASDVVREGTSPHFDERRKSSIQHHHQQSQER